MMIKKTIFLYKPAILFLLLCLLCVGFCRGQFGPQELFDRSVSKNSKFVAKDLNNDSLDDVVAASNGLGVLAYWFCLGDGLFSDQIILTNTYYSDNIWFEVVDMNADGWQDIVYSLGIAQAIFICYNLQNGEFSEPLVIQGIDYPLSFIVADFSNDMFPDILVLLDDFATVKLFNNLGNNEIVESMGTIFNTGGRYAALDVDADLDLDIATSNTSGCKIYINNGSAEFDQELNIAFSEPTFSMMPVEFNGDGYGDLLIQEQYSGGKRVVWWKNNTDGTFTRNILTTTNNTPNYAFSYFQQADFDGDGDWDYAFNGADFSTELNSFEIRLNDGAGVFDSGWSIFSGNYGYCISAASGHFNADEKFDFIITRSRTNLAHIYLANENNSYTDILPFASNTQLSRDINEIDWDEDGDMDLICHHKPFFSDSYPIAKGNISFFENNGNNNYEPQRIIEDSIFYLTNAIAMDFDSDGDDDIVHSQQGANLMAWMENLPGEDYEIHTFLPDKAIDDFLILDMDGDYDYDVVSLYGYSNEAKCYVLNENLGLETTYNLASPAIADNPVMLRSADLDNDGDEDFAFLSEDLHKIVWIKNNFPSFTTYQIPQSYAGTVQFELTDVDNDGDKDILVLNLDLYWYSNNGSGEFTFMNMLFDASFLGDFPLSMHVSDFDNDNDMDIVVSSYLAYYLQQVSPGTYSIFPMANYNKSDLIITTDVNSDGLKDLIESRPTITMLSLRINELGSSCSNPVACNYSPWATSDYGSCIFPSGGDSNCNGFIDQSDLQMMVDAFGCSLGCQSFDMNGDGIVGVSDLMILVEMLE
jgi:hypothetical protein